MGKLTALLLVALASVAGATDIPLGTAFYTQNATILTLASPNTNSISAGLNVEANLYHTVQVTISTNLAASATFVLDGSLDNANWTPLSTTNSIANTGGTVFLTATAKYTYLRLRNLSGTNAVGSAVYLGGR